MKKNLLIFVITLIFTQTGKCDTIDFWHVFYNKKMIGDFDQYPERRMEGKHIGNEIVINTKIVKNNDSIKVKYFRDTPCDECSTSLMIENENHDRVLVSKGRGTFNPVSFSVKDLIVEKKRSGNASFMVFYSEEQGRYGIHKSMLFRIKFE